jgi:hypothetical protein
MSNHRDGSDERTIATQQQWQARGMAILSIALSIDLIVRSLVLKQDPRQYLDIGLIWMATMLYAAIGMTASGVAPFGGKWWKMWPIIPIVVVGNTVTLARFGMVPTLTAVVLSVVSATIGLSVIIVILGGIYGVWERRTLGRGSREE